MQGRHDDELAVFDLDVFLPTSSLVEFSVSEGIGQRAVRRYSGSDSATYPKPPRLTSLVQTSVLKPLLQSSSSTRV